MPGDSELRVQPAERATPAERVQQYATSLPSTGSGAAQPTKPAGHEQAEEPGVSTAGHLRPAYAQYVVDPDTHEVVVRIRDAATDEVIKQIPSAELVALNASLRRYAETLSLRHAAAQGKAGA